MERLDGFRFDDMERYEEHGVDTHAIVRASMIGFMEGALIHGIFHGDLHGGNLYVRPDGKTALLDAICFALFGQASGTDRTSKSLRSDHAKPTLLTEVELEFMLNQRRYRVRRRPR